MKSSIRRGLARMALVVIVPCLALVSCAGTQPRGQDSSGFEQRYLLELIRGRAPTPEESERAPATRLRLTLPAGVVSSRAEPGRAWGRPEDLERLQGDREGAADLKDVVFEVAASGYVTYDSATNRFNQGPVALAEAMTARGWTDVTIQRHDVDGLPIESVAWTADGRRSRILYIAIAPQVRDSGMVVRVLMHDLPRNPGRAEVVWARLLGGLGVGGARR